MPEKEDELLKLRQRIDQLDADILARLSERARCAQRIGQIKQGNLYRPAREAQVLRRLGEANPGPLPEKAVKRIFREIMSACLAQEQALRVVYLGPPGTFSEAASHRHFGGAPDFQPLASIEDVFRAVEAGNADYGVVPVENTTEGAVGMTLDLLLLHPVRICGEVKLRIHQHLMSRAEDLKAVTRVYSHAQSLSQCHEWLNRHLPDVPRVQVASNAEAARLAAENPQAAAVAGEAAAQHNGLNLLASNIEDLPDNTTRFFVIAEHDAEPSGQDKTSLAFSSLNRPGAMYTLLAPLARHGVDMTKLESRPARNGLWEYVFYADVQGHRLDANVTAALKDLGDEAAFVKVLGSYPVAAI